MFSCLIEILFSKRFLYSTLYGHLVGSIQTNLPKPQLLRKAIDSCSPDFALYLEKQPFNTTWNSTVNLVPYQALLRTSTVVSNIQHTKDQSDLHS